MHFIITNAASLIFSKQALFYSTLKKDNQISCCILFYQSDCCRSTEHCYANVANTCTIAIKAIAEKSHQYTKSTWCVYKVHQIQMYQVNRCTKSDINVSTDKPLKNTALMTSFGISRSLKIEQQQNTVSLWPFATTMTAKNSLEWPVESNSTLTS